MVRDGDGTLTPDRLGRRDRSAPPTGCDAAASEAAALVGGGTTNEEGWLVQRIIREGLGSRASTARSSPVDAGGAAASSRGPSCRRAIGDIDYAGAILVARQPTR